MARKNLRKQVNGRALQNGVALANMSSKDRGGVENPGSGEVYWRGDLELSIPELLESEPGLTGQLNRLVVVKSR